MKQWRSLIITAVTGLSITIAAALILEQYDHKRIAERMRADAQSLEGNVRGSLIRLLYAGEIAGELLKMSDSGPAQQLPQLRRAVNSFYQSVQHITVLDEQLTSLIKSS